MVISLLGKQLILITCQQDKVLARPNFNPSTTRDGENVASPHNFHTLNNKKTIRINNLISQMVVFYGCVYFYPISVS